MYDPDAPQSQPGPQPSGGEAPAPEPPQPNAPESPPSGYPVYQGIPEKGPEREEEPGPAPYVPTSPYAAGRSMERQMHSMRKPSRVSGKSMIMMAMIIMAGLLLAYAVVASHGQQGTSSSTTVLNIKVGEITSCGKITSPGRYYLTQGINTQSQAGACINVTSDNVAILCNQNNITGSGPYSGAGPYSYGISVVNQRNVTINNCAISNFSYGVFLYAASNATVSDSNLSSNYMANIYMARTTGSNVTSNFLSHSTSDQGSIFISNGSKGNMIYNNTIEYDSHYGISVNATGNTYKDNYINASRQASFSCFLPDSYVSSSTAQGNVCYDNQGCSFVRCRGVNYPPNITKTTLTADITSCGTITTPGTYTMQNGIDVSKLIDTSNPNISSYNMPCIKIASDYVTLNCRGFAVSNATVGILASNVSNVTISGCRVSGSNTGISLSGVLNSTLINATLPSDGVSLLMARSGTNLVTQVKAYGGDYGALISSSDKNVFSEYNFSLDKYGIHLSSSQKNIFSNGFALNNSILDVYASADSANATNDTMQLTSCGLTNAAWATCTNHVTVNATYKPINSCGAISKPGNYTLANNVASAPTDCIRITSSDVQLNCMGNQVSASSFAGGSGILVSGVSNVTVRNCGIGSFNFGMSILNSTRVSITNVSIKGSDYGIRFRGVSLSSFIGSIINRTTNSSIILQGTSSTRIINNTILKPLSGVNVAMVLNDSRNNTLLNNTATQSYTGMYLTGSSLNNTISNNTMQQSAKYDYKCDGNSALADEQGGINYGNTKSGCRWLAVIPTAAPKQECDVALQPDIFALTFDAAYTFGSRCFSLFANYSTIDCQGHTIIATNGGTFAYIKNSTGGVVKNCNLKGFTAAIVSSNAGVAVKNDTITGKGVGTTGIEVNGYFKDPDTLRANNVSYVGTGIYLHNTQAGTLMDNIVSHADGAYLFDNATFYSVSNNTASSSSTGAKLVNSTGNVFLSDRLYGSSVGLSCDAHSGNRTSNTDGGNNFCSAKLGCSWMSIESRSC